MPAYDSTGFHPPAPIARVTLKLPTVGAVASDVLMLLDTGADVSLLPRSAVTPLLDKGAHLPQYEIAGYDGKVSLAPAVVAELIFLGKSFSGQFLVIDDRCGILGRNVLNNVSLLLDGPGLVWDEHL